MEGLSLKLQLGHLVPVRRSSARQRTAAGAHAEIENRSLVKYSCGNAPEMGSAIAALPCWPDKTNQE